jgi:hypothetical protein
MVDLRWRVNRIDCDALVFSMRTTPYPVPTTALPFAFILLALIRPPKAFAGPPYITDDPVPVEFQHWELYLASIFSKQPDAWTSTAPHIEVNYGVVPDVQLHTILPLTLYVPADGASSYGYGVTELGVKYRFVHESSWRSQLGVFPLLEVPPGLHDKNLGVQHLQAFLPLWLQKSEGLWTAYGGGGYWINPGTENRNWWFSGIVIQWQVLPNFAPCVELFHGTAQQAGQSPQNGFNLGLMWDLSDLQHIMFSAGPAFGGPNQLQGYFAYQLTFGS